jgi:Protein of unknown function (DUF1640)
MSTPRLLFLYPAVFRSSKAFDKAAVQLPFSRQRAPFRANFHAHHRCCAQLKRHGKAVEPLALSGLANTVDINEQEGVNGSSAREAETSQEGEGEGGVENAPPEPKDEKDASIKEKERELERVLKDAATSRDKPMETVLQIGTVPEDRPSGEKPPHLDTPQYVHHFDSWGMVRGLRAEGYSQEQAVAMMKAIRGLLGRNLDMARDSLVSKSNVENETYLFRAACSELRTEIQSSRRVEAEKMRTDRQTLQHEVDILNQNLTQMQMTLKEEVSGMFNNRKMTVTNEQSATSSKIAELNYKITVLLNSDVKSEIEGLRWVMTRRAVIALFLNAGMLLLCHNLLSKLRLTQY